MADAHTISVDHDVTVDVTGESWDRARQISGAVGGFDDQIHSLRVVARGSAAILFGNFTVG